jgi:hypothetical protein
MTSRVPPAAAILEAENRRMAVVRVLVMEKLISARDLDIRTFTVSKGAKL